MHRRLTMITSKLNAHSTTYQYAGTGYDNPHAPTSYFNGSATTTYTYDNNGNVPNAGSWVYAWDYIIIHQPPGRAKARPGTHIFTPRLPRTAVQAPAGSEGPCDHP